MRIGSLQMRPWAPGDESAFTPRADFAEERIALAWDWSVGPPGPTWTICRHDGQVLGIGGGAQDGTGRWEAWASLAEMRPREIWLAMMFAVVALRTLERDHGARLIFASCRAAVPAARRCLEMLGFSVTAAGYDPRLPATPLWFLQRSA